MIELLLNVMETNPGDSSKPLTGFEDKLSEELRRQLEAEKKISGNIMSVRLSPEGLIFKDASASVKMADNYHYEYTTDRLPGVYCEGVQYFDLNGVKHINNSGMVTLIDILKSLLEMGVEVQFVNVDESIKARIKDMGLEKIINCSGKKVEKRILL